MESKFFSEEFIRELPIDNNEAIIAIFNEFNSFCSAFRSKNIPLLDKVECIHIIVSFQKYRNLEWDLPDIDPIDYDHNIVHSILREEYNKSKHIIRLKKLKEHSENSRIKYENLFSKDIYYEFDDQDFSEIQNLINKLRELITNSECITARHRLRLLNRLEAMQGELHQKTSDIDRFWGFIGEAGIVIKKFGDDLTPLIQNVSKLSKIVVKAIIVAESMDSLPDIGKLLE